MSFPVVQLGDLCEMDRQGLGPDDCAAAGLPYVGVENVESHNGTINFANGSRVGSQRSTTFQFDERHILYAKLRPYLNKVATPDFSGRCSTELVPLLPRDGIDREFIAYLLRRNQTVEYVMASVTGSRMPRTDMKVLMSLPVSLPPLDEQRRIVGILNRAARIERLRKQAQALMREFTPALFVKIFGDPATNPMRWDKQKLGEVCFETEQRDPGKNPAKEFRYVDISGIDNVSKKINEFRLILGSEAPSRARKEVRRNDVLVSSVRPNLNAVAIVPDHLDDGIASTGFCILRADRKILDPLYLFLYVTSAHFIDIMVSKARGANYPAVSDKDIKDIQIPLPPLHIQRRFSDIAEAAQNAVERIELGDRTAAALSASLMSRLLEDAI